jgi:hypothetical protein
MVQPSPLFSVQSVEPEQAPLPSRADAAAIQMIKIALSALWQRYVIAVADSFVLFAGASVFALFYTAQPDPTVKQLIMLGLYAVFVLAASAMVLWRRGK